MAMSRRAFFKSIARETTSLTDELKGIPQCRLDELSLLPTERLERICPVILPDVKILIDGQRLRALRKGEPKPIPLLEHESEAAFLLSQFDGLSTLRVISERLASKTKKDFDRAFDRVRAAFLRLVDLGLSVPKNLV